VFIDTAGGRGLKRIVERFFDLFLPCRHIGREGCGLGRVYSAVLFLFCQEEFVRLKEHINIEDGTPPRRDLHGIWHGIYRLPRNVPLLFVVAT